MKREYNMYKAGNSSCTCSKRRLQEFKTFIMGGLQKQSKGLSFGNARMRSVGLVIMLS